MSNGGEHWLLAACGIKLATAGYGVFGIDYEGHGKSMGARCYIQKFENLVADCDRFFKSICAMEDYRNKSRFLYGESMGGAVALLLHRKDPIFWDGAVLVAPMCKISEKVKPHPVVITLLTQVEEIIPKWKILPTKDVIDSAFKDPVKREKIRKNKLIYQDKPRLKTALELLRTSMDVEDSLSEEEAPARREWPRPRRRGRHLQEVLMSTDDIPPSSDVDAIILRFLRHFRDPRDASRVDQGRRALMGNM
ncbi:caffeoylshikimate esterase-like [Setaria italica]|uniref:caffeoylshikimate esterase-like n=1 Tax=Setaria italica TaxID=4555 RepID=UPI0006454AC9|nr:caffeoylshikimate esterase-like [Setaria italica]